MNMYLQQLVQEMESLKAILAKKKAEVGTSINRADVEKKRVEQFREDQNKAEEDKQKKIDRKIEDIQEFYQPKKMQKTEEPEALTQTNEKIAQETEGKEEKEENLPKIVEDEVFNKKVRDEEEYEELEGKLRYLLIQPKLMDETAYRAKKLKMLQSNKAKDISLADKCDQILLWSRKIIKAWLEELELRHNTPEKKNTRSARDAFNLYKESCQSLEPLFIVLRARNGDLQMIESIYHIMNCSLLRDYREANDRYIEMSVGNAPWPTGVVMLGITVRKNTQRLAHVLSDPVSRKWTQSVKRLVTVSQELYPNQDNTKMVLYSVASVFG